MSEEARRIMDAHEAAGGNRNGKMPAVRSATRFIGGPYATLEEAARNLRMAMSESEKAAPVTGVDRIGVEPALLEVGDYRWIGSTNRLQQMLLSANVVESLESAKLIIQRAIPTLSDEEKLKLATMIEGMLPEEKPTPVTESEKLADQMVRDVPRLSPKDRPVVRKALDEADAYGAAREKTSDVWRRATGRPPYEQGTTYGQRTGWYEPSDGKPREVD